jgi:hypothetical protein
MLDVRSAEWHWSRICSGKFRHPLSIIIPEKFHIHQSSEVGLEDSLGLQYTRGPAAPHSKGKKNWSNFRNFEISGQKIEKKNERMEERRRRKRQGDESK